MAEKEIADKKVGIIVYMTPDERRYIHSAAARLTANGRRMSASTFVIRAALQHIESSVIQYRRQVKKDFYHGNLLVHCQQALRSKLHRLARRADMSTSEFILRAAMDEAEKINNESILLPQHGESII